MVPSTVLSTKPGFRHLSEVEAHEQGLRRLLGRQPTAASPSSSGHRWAKSLSRLKNSDILNTPSGPGPERPAGGRAGKEPP
jgi:hypothetical protein